MTDFATKLKMLRKEQKITQRELAEKTGIDFTYISKMENGKLENFPSIETIKKIAQALHTNENELILLANKVPEDIRKTIVDDKLAADFLRKVQGFSPEQREKLRKFIDET